MDEHNASSSSREVRIQRELNLRRSGSSFSAVSVQSLSLDEEDELEGKGGDSRSMSLDHTEMSRIEDAGISSQHQWNRGSRSDVQGAMDFRGNQIVPIIKGLAVPPVASEISEEVTSEKLQRSLELASILAHLAVFGIIGVIVRHYLDILFEPKLGNVTSENGALFVDLPPNMLGSFFMGWVGVVFKQDITIFSEHLAIGLSTGLMGSITTYASMVQRLLYIIVAGRWLAGICGLIVGLELAQMSLIVGIDSAQLLIRILERVNHKRESRGLKRMKRPSPDNICRRKGGLILFLALGSCLWFAAGILVVINKHPTSQRTLWIGCLVAPPGVWIRWYLARLNGQGIGPKHKVRWFPLGTFLVNVAASSIEAGLSTVLAVASRSSLVVSGIQLGLLGCMSTVSTLVAEMQIMHQGNNRWRAYLYPSISLVASFVIAFLVYGVPIWIFGYESDYLHS